MTEVLELTEHFKAAVIKCFNKQLWTHLRQREKRESLSKEKEGIKKNQIDILEPKNTITRMKKPSGCAQQENGGWQRGESPSEERTGRNYIGFKETQIWITERW